MLLLISLMCYDYLSSLLHRILRSLFFVIGASAKLRKATVSIAMSVCPSAGDNSAPTVGIFMIFDIRIFFENLSRRFKCH